MTDKSDLKKLKLRIEKIKKSMREPTLYSMNNNRILAIKTINLEKLKKKYRTIYMRVYSKTYYKNNPEAVIRAVLKYKQTKKGIRSRKKYDRSDKNKARQKRYEATKKAHNRQQKYRDRLSKQR